ESLEQARDSAEASLAERKNIEAMLRLDREQQAVLREMLENVVKGGPMKETLELCLSRLLEISWLSLLPKGGIFLMEEDAKTLRLYASHALSQEILTLCNRVPLGRCLCGAAAASREIQFSHCVDGRHEISYPGMGEHGHYNLPLLSEGKVIGVMVLYLPHGFERDQAKEQFLNSVAGILASFIRRKKAEEELRIAASAFESQEAMIVTDADTVILRVNRAFTEITGFTAEEAVGQTPRLLKSGRHGADFYRQMWESINRTGVWQGEIWDRRKNGNEYPKWLTISAVKNDEGTVTHYIGSHYDITEQKQAEEKINELAFFDQLTGLPNRMLLMDRLTQAMSTGSRTGRFGALLFIDLDNFKMLNDTQGHDVGDKFLKQVALRVRSCIREIDTVARLGGDEFVVVVSELSSNQKEAATDIEIVAEKILASFNLPYRLDYTDHHSTASIGVTLFRGNLATHDDLLKQADLAMYKAKAAGRNTIRFFDPAMEAAMIKQAALEGDLRQAIAGNQFLLHYQAQVESNGQMTGAEALIRWQHPERGLVPPDEFIPLAEDTGLILPIGLWVLDTACAQIKSWENDAHSRELQIAVNVSARQFRQPDFVPQVARVLETSGINPARLKLELTESLVLENVEDAIEKMHAIKRLGVRFSMDDFGTGYSSLSYLARLPLDQLKIDRSFVRNLPGKKNDETIARTIITMGRGLNMNVIAEGVETESQRAFLEAHGCDAYQGYLFSRPLPQTEFEEFARSTWRPRQESNL
ncbi:MAG: EAL domain-containing protein, partial [Parasulfuritortus sp.]|nr:EAL domain-containing protein [Parasulfuritortus sp.]